MKEFLKKYWLWLLIAIIVIVAGVLIYFGIYNSGKKSGVSAALATIPNPSVGDPYTAQEQLAIRTYASWFEKCLHWYVIQDQTQWAAFAEDTDRIMIGTSIQYTQDNPGASLYSDINNTLLNFADPDVVNTVTTRLKADLGI